jgi:pilus assembly protein Flp/PilA
MKKLTNLALTIKIWKDSRGQDLVEYALAAGFVVGAAVALSPMLGSSIVTVFNNVVGVLQSCITGGGGTASPTA